MDKNQILEEVQEIFRDVLDNEKIVLAFETTASDIDEWDSLTNIQLISEVSKKYNISFKSIEIISWANVDDIIAAIQHKLEKK